MYECTTNSIRIIVTPQYLDDDSRPEESYYVWAYHIVIENHGSETVTLRTRHWKITDARGRVQEVHGDGVVGEQPTLRPGESYEYSSGAPLPTPSGFMSGSYWMETADGKALEVRIPAFSLDSPHASNRRH